MNEVLTYKDSGVDVNKGDLLVDKIKDKVKKTYNKNVLAGVGGFCSLYKITEDRYLTAGTDGVGTKIILAQELKNHSTIGQDLVAMCVNDIICSGSRPLFFMDYIASGKLDIETNESLIDGISKACLESNMALIGGETAEMPGLYNDGEYDLAGFSVGEVYSQNLIDGSKLNGSESLVAISSSGFHSNGYSLIRKLLNDNDIDLKRKLLKPTKLYTKLVLSLHENNRDLMKGIAHITGGGLKNIARMNKEFDYEVNYVPDYNSSEFIEEVGDEISIIAKRSGLCEKELYTTFNMGMGLVIATSNAEQLMAEIKKTGHLCYEIGRVFKGENRVILKGNVL